MVNQNYRDCIDRVGKKNYKLEKNTIIDVLTIRHHLTERINSDNASKENTEQQLNDSVAFFSVLSRIRGVDQSEVQDKLWQILLDGLVEIYGFRMAWYGSYKNQQIVPLYSSGLKGRYLDNLVLKIGESDNPEIKCAMSHAILNKKPFGYSDLSHDEGFKKCREYAPELGYGSNLAIAAIQDGQPIGGVLLYDIRSNAFYPERIKQLCILIEEVNAIVKRNREQKRADKKLKKSEEKYKRLFRATHEALIVSQFDGTIKLANYSAAKMFGYKNSRELIGKSILSFYSNPNDRKRLINNLEENGLVLDNEIEYKKLNGSLFWVLGSFVLVSDSKGLFIEAYFTDITERKLSEEALKESREKLSQQNVLLQEKNIAMRELMFQIEGEMNRFNTQIKSNVERLLMPLVHKLRNNGSKLDKIYIDLLEENLQEITSQFGINISDQKLNLAPKEIEISSMIKNGLTSKEIAALLNISHRTVETHRNNIRKKLGIGKKNVNLVTYFKNLS